MVVAFKRFAGITNSHFHVSIVSCMICIIILLVLDAPIAIFQGFGLESLMFLNVRGGGSFSIFL